MSLIHPTGLLMADSRSTCMLEAGELIVARVHPEDVRAVGELVGKDSKMPFRDSSGDGVTRSGRVRRIVVGGCPINPGKNVVAIRVDGMDKGKTKKEAYDACVHCIRFVVSRSDAGLRGM